MKNIGLTTINQEYPKSEWLRMYTDGSLGNSWQDAGAGRHCKNFSQYLTLDENANHYDGILEEIIATLQNILYRPHITKNQQLKILLILKIYI